MKGKLFIIPIILCLFIYCGYQQVPNVYDEQEDLKQVKYAINGAIGWAKTKDFSMSNKIIANDPDYLEVDPDTTVVRGFKEFKKREAFFATPRFKAVRYELRDLKINFSKSHDVAWFYTILDDINEWDGKPISWLNTRWTGVLEKREGNWVIVQMHFSFAQK